MNNNEILNLIKELIEKTGVSVKEISIMSDDTPTGGEGIVWFQVEVGEPHLYLARGGEALSALNHMVRKIVETRMPDSKEDEIPEIMIDINGFQKKRVDNLRAVAHMMAERARYFKSNIEVDPMPAFERRIVHEFLSGAPDLKTESEGTGASRRVVIKYIGSV
ncbi:MAG TPA: R3H domain-containing nucleic acid-binding protein [Candidatus Paceibacterota bacterium]|jgi:spoIIIJ-associated protein|nr:R3H domain-containing nucleic acid-binding protein [Candidatus Paceibacterota bacterium]